MSEEKIKFGKSKVFFDTFTRRPGPIKKNMHYELQAFHIKEKDIF